MVVFRNLEITSEAPVAQWGVEGMLAVIDRGSMPDWQRIVRAVLADPHGEASQDLEQALDLAEDAGVAASLRRIRERARQSDAQRLAHRFRGWVEATGLTRAELAAYLGTSRSRLSTYETGKVTPSAIIAEKVRRLAEQRRWMLL